MRHWLPSWGVLFALYLLLVGQVSAAEAVAGALTAAAAASLALLVRRLGSRAFQFRLAWLWEMRRPVRALFVDLVRIGRVLARALAGYSAAGTVVRQPFAGEGDVPFAAARCGVVTLAASFAPNGYVLGIAPETLLLHRLAPQPATADREWPM